MAVSTPAPAVAMEPPPLLEAPASAVAAPTGPPQAVSSASRRRRRVAKVYTCTQIAQALERVAAIGVRPAAAELGISRTTLREWERKVARAAKGEGPAPTSGPDPKTVEDKRDAAIRAEWTKQRGATRR